MDEQKEREDAFKVGFLFKLAQSAVLPSELVVFLKTSGILDPLLSGAIDVGKSSVSALPGAAMGAADLAASVGIAGPPILGAAAGGLHKLLQSPVEDTSLLQKAELADLYSRLSSEVRSRMKLRNPPGRKR
jgi:hypothetical protein